ncbi:oxysterol-binding protein-related protein 6-like isoform X2 [Rhodnius prolixus]|uniref:oxysterol-binding protein-related protein 6-like isoform X2 n=1 Tax=Rhodnius prolixus TaxID=13249 RepID=UPI003D188E14
MSSTARSLADEEKRKSPQNFKRNDDSDASGESNSLSQDSNTEVQRIGAENNVRLSRRSSEWEILEGLRDGQRYEVKPEVFTGYLHKKRKWPLKGWHKRYFLIDTGILKYGKSPSDMSKGKIHGSVDIGLSVISTKSKRKRIDIDAEEFIYHLKAKQYATFAEWAEQLKKHRLYRQHLLTFGGKDGLVTPLKETPQKSRTARDHSRECAISPQSLRLDWVMASGPLQVAATELNHTQQALGQLAKILEQITASNNAETDLLAIDGSSPNVKKDRKKFGLRKKKAKGSSVDLTAAMRESENCLSVASAVSCPSSSPVRPSSMKVDHQFLVDGVSLDQGLASDFYILAKDIYTSLKSVMYTMNTERERLKDSSDEKIRSALQAAIKQNEELRARLQTVHRIADTSDLQETNRSCGLHTSLSRSSCASEFYDAEEGQHGVDDEEFEEDVEGRRSRNVIRATRPKAINHVSNASAEDACSTGVGTSAGGGRAPSDCSSEAEASSEDETVSSQQSDMADSEYNNIHDVVTNEGRGGGTLTGRRSKLPAPRPSTEGLSLWNLLTKNIGKDLSQVSMPVALNEPLNMLQRMCEELEYSEILDKAAQLDDPLERMVYVSAFAVSAYGSAHLRAGSKPFNPLLGETYEAIREDRGFRFISEQVSHHPPVSVCHASSKNFIFWQDTRIKTKFWGKSMEFQPLGSVYLKLERPDSTGKDFYKWNKVTTCVHNLFGGTRWVDQYGELTIHNQLYTCKITFVRASYWSTKKYECHGTITDNRDHKVVGNLFGKWNEGLYTGVAPSARCIWRPGSMPPDYELYYGFTRFAIELNELEPDAVNYLPCTDTRFRPDQRLLEEGKLEEAERVKSQLEQSQRERRKSKESQGITHQPRWFRKTFTEDGEETWEFKHEYWNVRKNPGFVNLNLDPLW